MSAPLAEAVRVVKTARRHGAARVRVVSLVLAVALVTVFALSLAVGDFTVPLGDLPGILLGNGTGGGAYVVTELRLPRAVTGLLVGSRSDSRARFSNGCCETRWRAPT